MERMCCRTILYINTMHQFVVGKASIFFLLIEIVGNLEQTRYRRSGLSKDVRFVRYRSEPCEANHYDLVR